MASKIRKKKTKQSFYKNIILVLLIIILLLFIYILQLLTNFLNIKTHSENNSKSQISLKDKLQAYSKSISSFRTFVNNLEKEKKEHPPEKKGIIAVILDDGGYEDISDILLKLPIPVSVSILPFLPYSKIMFEKLNNTNVTTLLHMPMEPKGNEPLENYYIFSGDSRDSIRMKIESYLAEIPASYANNHMGSKVSENAVDVQNILSVLQEKNIRFIDSRTSSNSLFYGVGKNLEIKVLENSVFLDNYNDVFSISQQFEKGIQFLSSNDYVIMIGHCTKKSTLDFLFNLQLSLYSNYNFLSINNLLKKILF